MEFFFTFATEHEKTIKEDIRPRNKEEKPIFEIIIIYFKLSFTSGGI